MNNELTIQTLLNYLAIGCILITTLVSLWHYKYLSVSLKLLSILLCISSVITVVMTYLSIHHTNNLVYYNVYTIVEFIFLGFFFQDLFSSRRVKILVLGLILVFTGFAICNLFFIEGISNYNSYSLAIESILCIGLSLFYFLEMFKELKIPRLEKSPYFWINTGILFYFSGNLFLFTFSHYLQQKGGSMLADIYIMSPFIGIVYYTLLTIGLWNSRKT